MFVSKYIILLQQYKTNHFLPILHFVTNTFFKYQMYIKWVIIIIDTPLHMASGDAVGTHLLNFGADAFLTNKRGLTPIETAKQQGRTSLVRMFQKAQEQAHRNMLAKERERRAIIRARHKEMEIEDKKKLAEQKKAAMKAEYLRFRHKGSKKKKTTSIFKS